MKLTDDDKYRLGYTQGYCDAIKEIASETNRKREWASDSLDAIIKELFGERRK